MRDVVLLVVHPLIVLDHLGGLDGLEPVGAPRLDSDLVPGLEADASFVSCGGVLEIEVEHAGDDVEVLGLSVVDVASAVALVGLEGEVGQVVDGHAVLDEGELAAVLDVAFLTEEVLSDGEGDDLDLV